MRNVQPPEPSQARALALAAIRETFEETGLLLGARADAVPTVPDGPWSAFARAKVLPDLAHPPFHRPRHHAAAAGRAASMRASSPWTPARSRTGSRA